MNFKHALETVEVPVQKEESTMVKLTNAFRFVKEVKEESRAKQSARIRELAWRMRRRWEAFHDENGTWYDYSDNESLCSDTEDEEDVKELDDEYDE
jgi:hypothetical protein